MTPELIDDSIAAVRAQLRKGGINPPGCRRTMAALRWQVSIALPAYWTTTRELVLLLALANVLALEPS